MCAVWCGEGRNGDGKMGSRKGVGSDVKGGRGGGGKGQEALTSACVQEELLMRASREGKTSLVKRLVACGAKPGETDEVREDEQGKRGGVGGWVMYRGRGAGLVNDQRRRKQSQGEGGGVRRAWAQACVRDATSVHTCCITYARVCPCTRSR